MSEDRFLGVRTSGGIGSAGSASAVIGASLEFGVVLDAGDI